MNQVSKHHWPQWLSPLRPYVLRTGTGFGPEQGFPERVLAVGIGLTEALKVVEKHTTIVLQPGWEGHIVQTVDLTPEAIEEGLFDRIYRPETEADVDLRQTERELREREIEEWGHLPKVHLTDDLRRQFANEADAAVEHPLVQNVMEEFADNMRFDLEGLPEYGLQKIASYAAQVSRCQALGIDPDELRASHVTVDTELLRRLRVIRNDMPLNTNPRADLSEVIHLLEIDSL